MKSVFITALVLLTVMLSFPLAVLDSKETSDKIQTSTQVKNIVKDTKKASAYDSFRLKCKSSDKIIKISANDYVKGVVAGEMPALYEKEALKAQAVAAYTYACRKKDLSKNNDYDITDDPNTDQCYISEETARSKWGDKADEYIKKISDAVAEVEGYMLTFDGSAALTAYHAISSGKTENCSDIWGSDLPYLVSVDSSWDKIADNYLTTVQLSADELSQKLNGFAKPSGSAETWFSDKKVTNSGTVKTIKYGEKEVSGFDMANSLSLRSANFEVSFADNTFNFTVCGYGHGLGMSQNGANYMAKQGSSYEEILSHYYKGCKLKKL